jgi:uncharacterized membrane protein (DUF485 family)
MTNISDLEAGRILGDPRFRRLVAERARLRWGLSAVVLGMFFGLIALMSATPGFLGQPFGSPRMTVGLALVCVLFISVVLVTGFYVHHSNQNFEGLMRSVREDCPL